MPRTVCDQLAALGVELRERGLSAGETQAAVRAVVDWFGATIAGSALEPARILRAALLGQDEPGPGESGPVRLVPDGRPAALRTAATPGPLTCWKARPASGPRWPGRPTGPPCSTARAGHSGSRSRPCLAGRLWRLDELARVRDLHA